MFWSVLTSVDAELGQPLRMGNTSGLPSPSARAASRTSSARPHSRTRCSRFTFIRYADRVRGQRRELGLGAATLVPLDARANSGGGRDRSHHRRARQPRSRPAPLCGLRHPGANLVRTAHKIDCIQVVDNSDPTAENRVQLRESLKRALQRCRQERSR